MRILLMTKFSEPDEFVLQFANKIHQKKELELDLLHVINAYSEIPLKEDGEIIDHCVDVEITPLLKRQQSFDQLAQDWKERNPIITSSSVVIGDMEKIMEVKLKDKSYDAIFMGAHPTNLFEDWISNTTIEKVLEKVDIPVLSLKCDRSNEKVIDRIGVFNDFESESPEKIQLVSAIASAFNSEVHLYKILNGEVELGELERKMKNFATENHLQNVKYHVLNDQSSEERQMNKHMIEEQLNLIVIPELHRKSMSWLYPKSFKTTLANHLFAPLIIY